MGSSPVKASGFGSGAPKHRIAPLLTSGDLDARKRAEWELTDKMWADWQLAQLRSAAEDLEAGQMLIAIETCHSCQCHGFTTRHKDGEYERRFNALLATLQLEFADDSGVNFHPQPILTHNGQGGMPRFCSGIWRHGLRLGALEVLAITRRESASGGKGPLQLACVHSKLRTRAWPNPDNVTKRLRARRSTGWVEPAPV